MHIEILHKKSADRVLRSAQRVENPLRGFPPDFFAVCCAHNLFVYDEQIPHLQPEKYFLLSQKTLRDYFYSLGRGLPLPYHKLDIWEASA